MVTGKTRLVKGSATTLVVFLFLAAGTLTFAQSHTTVRHYKERIEEQFPEIAQAEADIEKKDFAAAEPLLKKVLEKDPNNYQAWFDLGFVLNGLARTEESISAYRKSVAAKTDVFESNLNLGLMLARSGNPEAEEFLRAATNLTPTNHVEEGRARAWLALAHLAESKKPEEALQDYRKAAELTPKDAEPHLFAGALYERQKQFSDAEAEYKQAMTVDPHSSEAAVALANIYMKSNRLEEAEPLLRRLAAEQRPQDESVHLQLARVLDAENKKDDAIAELQIALKLTPSDADAQREIAGLYASAGKNDLAEASYRNLIAVQPNDPESHRGLGKALLWQKKFPEAQQEFLVALRLKRDSPDVYVDLAFAANENKNYELVVRALNGRSMLNAELPPICFFLRASAYDHLHDYKQAALDYHHFLDVGKGKYPDQEWQATHRLIAIDPKRH
jgi:Flp pilus assembly protein TadD